MQKNLVDRGIEYALSVVRGRYQNNPNPEDDLPFHGDDHTTGVINRGERLARAMRLTNIELQYVRIACTFHDTVQEWDHNPTTDGKVMRKRRAGANEAASARELIWWLRNNAYEIDVITEELLTTAILATVPGWDAANSTVFQPNLKPDSHPVVRCVALADLGTAGMEGRNFAREGDPLFREENLDIAAAIRKATSRTNIPTDVQDTYKARMLGWSRSQAGFARGRKARLEIELGNLDEELKRRVRAHFEFFEAAIRTADDLVTDRQDKPFWSIAEAMGYTIPPP